MSKISSLINDVTDMHTRRALEAVYKELAAAFNNHTHNGDGAQVGAYYTSKPRSDTETVTAGTPLEI